MQNSDFASQPGMGDGTENPTDDLKARAIHEYDDARERLTRNASRARSEAGASLLHSVTDELDRRKSGFGEELRALADTLRHASDEQAEKARTGAGAAPSKLLGQGAGLIEDLSRSLDDTSVEEMGRRVSGFARSNPALFVGSCLLAGLAVGRVLTASAAEPRITTPEPSHDIPTAGPPTVQPGDTLSTLVPAERADVAP